MSPLATSADSGVARIMSTGEGGGQNGSMGLTLNAVT